MAIENINEIEKALKLPENSIKEALAKEENVKIELPSIVLVGEDVAKRDSAKYNEGKIAGLETPFKPLALKEKFGIDITGKTRDIETFAEAFKAKILEDAKIEPEQKVKELMTDLEKVQSNLKAKESEFEAFKTSYQQEKTNSIINDAIFKAIPDNVSIDKTDVATIFKSNYGIEFDDAGKMIVKKGNEILKTDATLEPKDLKTVINEFILEKKLVKVEGGRGSGDEGRKGSTDSLESFNKLMESKGVKIGSREYNSAMMQEIKAGKLKV